MIASPLTDEELDRHALQLLLKELGPEGLARFLRRHRPGTGDYSAERNQWLDGVSLDEVVRSVQARNQRRDTH